MECNSNIVKRLRENRLLRERTDYENMDRNSLIALAKEGNQLAMSTLIDQHQDFLRRMTKKYILDTQDRDDITQIATIAFWDAIMQWDGKGDFEAFAGMKIKRRMVDEIRKDDTEKTRISTKAAYLDSPVGADDEGGEMTLGSTLQSNGPSIEEEVLGREGARKLMKFLKEELSEVERKVILLYIEGYKVSEIAKEEDMKYKTVENALKRVKDKLAERRRKVKESKLNEKSLFSEEEKKVLKSMLSKIEEGRLQEAATRDKDLEDLTDEEIETALDDIEAEAEELLQGIKDARDLDEYNDMLERVSQLKYMIYEYEDLLDSDDTGDLFKQCQSVYRKLEIAENEEPENLKKVDPYEEVGMRRSDF